MVTVAVGTLVELGRRKAWRKPYSTSNKAGESKSWQKHYSRGKSVIRGKHVFQCMNVADLRDNGKSASPTLGAFPSQQPSQHLAIGKNDCGLFQYQTG